MTTLSASANQRVDELSKGEADLLQLLLDQDSQHTRTLRAYPRENVHGGVRAPTSRAQQRLWFIDELEGGLTAYNIATAMRLTGPLDPEALRHALDGLIRRHEVLRTTFASLDGVPWQIIASDRPFALTRVDLDHGTEAEREAHVRTHQVEEIHQKFDLRAGPLIRGRLLKLRTDEHVLLLTMHHIISDGWSMGVVIRELSELYGAYRNGEQDSLPPLPIQYADYAQWQRQDLLGPTLKPHLDYWRKHLEGAPPHLDLPTDHPRPPVQSYRGESAAVAVSPTLTRKLNVFAKRHEMSLFMVLYAAWTVLLSRLSGERDIVIGTPIANRNLPEVEDLIGYFINTLALRIEVAPDLSLRRFLERVKEVTLGAYDHQDVPFEEVVEAVQPHRSLSRNPVFQAMFVLQNAPRNEPHLAALRTTFESVPDEPAIVDITLSLEERHGAITGSLNYATDLFDRATAERWIGCLITLLEGMTEALECPLGKLPLLPAHERHQVLAAFNATATEYPQDRSIHGLFEEHVARAPTAVAALYEDESLTYEQLNARANHLAHALIDRGVRPGEYLPVLMPRSLNMLVTELAVLKCGAAYVPVDPTLPWERQAFLIRDCGARRVLTDQVPQGPLEQEPVDCIDCTQVAGPATDRILDNPQCPEDPCAAAYIMYTSGSTGTPKGVIVPHRAVVRLAIHNGYADIEPSDRLAHCSNPAFDASTFEIWGALLNGASVWIVPPSVVLEARQFATGLDEHHVTLLWMTIGLFSQYTEALAPVFRKLRYLLTGGDVVEPRAVRRVLHQSPPQHLLSAYGPTECTTFSTTYQIEQVDETTERIPIGRPIANAQVYILDTFLQPVPIGVTGELYIGGAGVARGYLNRPELTEERFIRDPYSTDPQGRLYKTGDLGRWRADGNIEYLGRNDTQVKIRGFRIELGEIEAQLLKQEGVKEAVVLTREAGPRPDGERATRAQPDEPGDKRLVAYVIAREETPQGLNIEALRTALKSVLPEHMVPSAFVQLAHFPLSPNGKLDRKALPAPERGAYAGKEYESPQGEVEEILAGIWQSLLKVEQVGRQDNFFELGGHSLLIVQMMERLRRVGLSAEVRRVFESPRLSDLASVLGREVVGEFIVPPNLIPPDCEALTPAMLPLVELEPEHLEQIERCVPGGATNIQDIYPLAPLQEGILFHHLLNENGGDTYILPLLLQVSSYDTLQKWVAALQAVIDRHDILRTAVLWEHLPRAVQVVYRRAILPVQQIVLDRIRDPQEQFHEWMRPERQKLNLRQAPLIQLKVAADPHGAHWYVLLQMHHIICDHVTLDAIVAEVVAHLEGHARQPHDSVPYRNHVAQSLAYARTHDAASFFRGKLGDVDESTAPFGLVDVRSGGSDVAEAQEELDATFAAQVRTQARRLGVSAATLFHAAWGLVVARASGRDDVVYGTVLLGRLQGSAGSQQILGMFINTLPLRLRLEGVTAKELVERTQRELVELLGHEQASLAEAQRCSGIAGSTPLFTALLNYRHSTSDSDVNWGAASGVQLIASQERTNYPLAVMIDDLGAGFSLTAQTDRRIDPHQVTSCLLTAMQSLVEALAQSPQAPALSLSVLPQAQRHQLFEVFNATQAVYSQDRLIHELFEAQVERTPQAIAVEFEGQSLTYAQLNAKANQLGRYLREQGVGPEQLVGICVERSLEMVVGLLGILKAGGAYVPLDPHYPVERLAGMLEEATPRVLLTQEHLRTTLPATSAQVLALDTDWDLIGQHATANLEASLPGPRSPGPRPDQRHHLGAQDDPHPNGTERIELRSQLMYVIYTSGSTGRPKGAMNEHRALVNRLEWMQSAYGLTPQDRVLQKTPFSFDVSGWEFFWTLLYGARLVLARPEGHKDPLYLRRLIEERGVTRLHFVPSMLQVFLDQYQAGTCASLRQVVCSGEELPASLQRQFFECFPQVRLSNLYGPTEAAIDVTSWECSAGESGSRVPIGRPIWNTQMHVLDAHRQPVPLGVSGELYIGGVGVGRGYLNRPELTEERFIRDPYSTDPQARLYKTGDLARWRPDGALEYLGRNDTQVKIRGFRIELGEIETLLLKQEGVKEAVVLAREAEPRPDGERATRAQPDEPGDKRLVAYVIAREETPQGLNIETLRTALRAVLPEHMVPSAFVQLAHFPLSPNGKLDRKALPAPERGAYAGKEYESPQGEVEEILAGIWQSLLKVEQVGRQDNFFELGGHSLLIVQMMERLRRVGLSAEVRRVFESPRLSDLASVLGREVVGEFIVPPNLIPPDCEALTPAMLPLVELEPEHLEQIERCVPGGATNIQDIYPLAPLQEGILFHHLLNKNGGDTYILALLLSVASQERLEELIAALQAVIDRHDILRTAVLWEHLPRAVQVVYRRAVLPVQPSTLDPDRDPLEQLRERMRPERQKLDLRAAPLLRLQVMADSNGASPSGASCYAILQLHHMTCDHVTVNAIVAEVVAHLERRELTHRASLPYRHHVAQSLAHARANDAASFFARKLGDVDEPTAPFGLLNVHGDGSEVEEAQQDLEPAFAAQVRAQARRLGVSAATLFHAAWGLVVARTSGRDDVVYGTVLLGRLQGSAGSQQILGMFINTLPLRLRLEGVTAKELVERTQRELVELLGHEQASLAEAQRSSGISGSAPLFTALLNYRHSTLTPDEDWADASGLQVLSAQERTNYPIVVSVDDLGAGFSLTAQTDRRIDPHQVTSCLLTAMQSLVEALAQAPQAPALSLSVLPQAQRHQLFEVFNATQAVYSQDRLIHELFEAQVERTPQAIAVEFEGQSLTYAQLNAKANQLGRYLREQGVGPEQLVGICVERSLEMVVGLLGILKAGGAYVPLDPHYPVERLAGMLEEATPRVLLTQEHLRTTLPATSAQVLALDADWDLIGQHATANLEAILPGPHVSGPRPDQLMYVIYTSGSTGRPKGAMNEHRALVNRLEWMQSAYGLTPQDRVLQKTPFSFDVSGWEFFWTLLYGARLVLARPEGHKDPLYLRRLIEERGVTRLHFVPSMLQVFLDQYPAGTCASLRQVVCSGEELPASLQRQFFECLPQVRLSNLYGPTEAAIDVTSWECSAGEPGTRVPIGRPIWNTQMHVLDAHRQPVPLGVSGELYIGGVGVGRGYLNRPELTEERFIRDPYSADPQGRLYKTGDLSRWRPDGALEYLGRNDTQVKIRGFRIELGEIEAQLLKQEGVKEAVVLAREDEPGDKRLVAYVVARDRTLPGLNIEALRTALKSVLPEHMVPSAFVQLEHFPLSPNGKLDRKALPAPERGAYAGKEYESPQGEVEEILAGIWQTLLKVEQVGRQDNFFELGGHSLLIVQMMERLRRVGLSAEVRRVFESPRLSDLASVLGREVVGEFIVPPNLIPPDCEALTPAMLPLVELEPEHLEQIVRSVPGGATNIQDIYPLAPLQEGILFHHLLNENGGDTYILPTVLSVASRERLEDLISALQAVIDRHDILRTAVLWEELPAPLQVVYRQATLRIQEIALARDRNPMEQIQEWIKPERQHLDLAQAPLLQLQIAPDPHGEQWYVLLQLHHIVCDHVTVEIVMSEVVAHLEGSAEILPPSIPYRHHVAQALAYARTHDADAFFRRKLSDVEEPTAPFGLLDVHGDGSQVDEAYHALEPLLAQRVRRQARRLGVSAATVFHAAWGLVTARTSARDDVVFGSVLLGRMQGQAGAQRILGMFINTLPLRLKMQGMTAKGLVEQTQRELVELLTHEQASLAAAQRCSGISGTTPLFTTLLNYRHSAPNTAAEFPPALGIRVLAGEERANYPILISVDDLGDGFALTAQTDRRLDPHRITAYLRTAVESLVHALEQAPQTAVSTLSVLPSNEWHQVVDQFNATYRAYPKEKPIHQLFEEQVARTPQALALTCGTQRLTYADLNRKANQLAGYLRDRGIGPDRLVALYVERSLEMVIGMLGTLKAGGAYVPLDPRYPHDRLAYLLSDAAPSVLLTQARLIGKLPQTPATVFALDRDWSTLESQPSTESQPATNTQAAALGLFSHHLAYVIYTSGSTGKPKGVMVEHANLANLVDWHIGTFGLTAGSRGSGMAGLGFDASTWEIWPFLCSGGTVLLWPGETSGDPQAMLRWWQDQDLDVTFLITPLFELAAATEQLHSRVRTVLIGGDQLRRWPHALPEGQELFNNYGPTETTIVATSGRLSPHDEGVHIGRPIANTRVYILDSCSQPVPIGVTGELYVGGDGIARGYLNQPELTTERFVRDPFSADPQARLYRTGDLGRWRSDGNIEYLGRNDTQVKIRGFRIELGEIESQLLQQTSVKEAVVIAREEVPGDLRLVAYVVPHAPSDTWVETVRSQLTARLPEYMVPSAFVVLDHLPMTANGKLDRRALPAPELAQYLTPQYEPPQGELEEALATIWQEVLGRERIGRHDHFFELGGHSLSAVRVVTRVRQVLGAEVTPRILFSTPHLDGFAKSVDTLRWLRSGSPGSAPPEKAFTEEGVL